MVALLRECGLTGWRRQLVLRTRVESSKLSVEGLSRRGKQGVGKSQPSTKNPQLRIAVDFVFRRERVAVFVDGCFWHQQALGR